MNGRIGAKTARRTFAALNEDEDWSSVGRLGAIRLERALARDLGPGHALQGVAVAAVARSNISDDVLFLCPDGRFAQVHMTWAPQTQPEWPATTMFDTLDEVIGAARAERAYEGAIHRSFALVASRPEGPFTCPACGSDWGESEAGEGCALCGGWGLARPCPVCDGACGAIWDRAVIDSIDSGEAIWIGKCGAPEVR